jgi:choline dehydrogenase-like flavoprotein
VPITRTERRPIGEVDLLVVGSGPVGATVAATVSRLRPSARILILDAGATVTDPPGANLRGLPAAEQWRLDQGNVDPLSFALERQATSTHGLQSVGLRNCVGGMGSIWSAAVPRPLPWEVPDLVPWPEMTRRLDHAERLLGLASSPVVPEPALVRDLRVNLACISAVEGRRLRPRRLPGAEVRRGGRVVPAGTATILGAAGRRTTLSDRSLCRRLCVDAAGRVRSAEIVDVTSGEAFTMRMRAVAVAANTFRTPQLLWASGIRPAALGRHLHEHPMVNAHGLLPRPTSARPPRRHAHSDVAILGRTWLPGGQAGGHAHGQVLHLGAQVERLDPHAGSAVVLGWYVAQDVDPNNRLDFGNGPGDDGFGMPVPRVMYRQSRLDDARIGAAVAEMRRLHDAGVVELSGDGAPRVAVRGLSRHFLGTIRMGRSAHDSVCDDTGRVWGHPNLFVCGTGVIGWPTACNPTLTAMAHACRTGEEITMLLAT